MDKTDPTIESVTRPYTLTKQLRLMIQDRDTDIATIGAMGAMMSRRYLESLRDDALIHMIYETVRSVNDIISRLIMDTIPEYRYTRVDTEDTLDLSGRVLQDTIWYIEQSRVHYEIVILRRIAIDVIDILGARGGADE